MKNIQTIKEDILRKGEEFSKLQKTFDNEPCRMCGLNGKYINEFLSQSLDRIEKQTREETIKEVVEHIIKNLVNTGYGEVAIEDYAWNCIIDKLTSQKEEGKSINDLLPFEHGSDGTHGACQAMIEKYGGQAGCCVCNGHTCKEEK